MHRIQNSITICHEKSREAVMEGLLVAQKISPWITEDPLKTLISCSPFVLMDWMIVFSA